MLSLLHFFFQVASFFSSLLNSQFASFFFLIVQFSRRMCILDVIMRLDNNIMAWPIQCLFGLYARCFKSKYSFGRHPRSIKMTPRASQELNQNESMPEKTSRNECKERPFPFRLGLTTHEIHTVPIS